MAPVPGQRDTPGPLVDGAFPPPHPEWTRYYAVERREGVAAMRGLFFGLLFSAPIAAGIVAGILWLCGLFG